MQMLYNSDSYVVLLFDVPVPQSPDTVEAAQAGVHLSRGGYEIVDKFARKEVFIEGALAERFKLGVQALVDGGPTEELLDEYIAGFTHMAQQAVTLH